MNENFQKKKIKEIINYIFLRLLCLYPKRGIFPTGVPREFINICTSDMNLFSSPLAFLSLLRTPDKGGRRPGTILAETVFEVEATEASLSLLDSPGDVLRFFRFLLGLPFNFGAGRESKTNQDNFQNMFN